jgi:omega-amidase
MSSNSFNIAMCQILVGADKKQNVETASKSIEAAVKNHGAEIVVLPECFNCPYSNDCFLQYSEYCPDVNSKSPDQSQNPTAFFLSEVAKKLNIYLVGGSIPERVDVSGNDHPKLYNTCMVFDPTGNLIAKHRKVHLFDINVPGKIKFVESETLTPGSNITTFEVNTKSSSFKVGLGICYDMRFAEYAQILSKLGCSMILYPGAFNTVTGPAHWELLQRGRAVDNQLFVGTCSPARTREGTGYQAWGHSTIVDPWGTVLATTDHDPSIVSQTIDLNRLLEVRTNIPIGKQKRHDLYEVKQV